ncbi:M28 family peptidase [Maribacter sp. R77961]|uniref:M28 family peptidase n=1 Tax=Maribacter sp. R77961 TaxID=3093871 RepID=UPI0037CCAA3B
MKKHLLFIGLLFVISLGFSQEKILQQTSEPYFEIIRPEFDGKLAYETTAFVEQYWRVAGNTGFNKSVFWIAEHLEKSGYVLESKAKDTDRLTYRIEKRAMDNPTWEPVSASLYIKGEKEPLLLSTTNRNMTYLNSVSTPKSGLTAEVVSLDDNPNGNIKGKIVYTESRAGKFYDKMVAEGALGIITYNNPSYLQPEKNTTSIQFRSLPNHEENKLWGIALSYEANQRLKTRLKNGKTNLKVSIQTKIYPSEELTVVADIIGKTQPDQRLVFSAHIQEPGANDNATGVGVQLEMAALTAKLFKEEKIALDRTLTFLWGDEIISTRRYIEEDKKRAAGIKWGISLDMLGENTAITGGSFLIEKMPDPSAIWTRGNDKHSEWGGEVLSLTEMKPHYLNDFIIANFKKQGTYSDWEVNTNPFEGGSDHTPFLDADIPGLLLWHFTDQFYHTDNDRLDKVSKKTLKNVGIAALTSGLELVNSDTETALDVLKDLRVRAKERLEQEYALSTKEIVKNSTVSKEVTILNAWEDWYSKAFETVSDMSLVKNQKLGKEIRKAKINLMELNKKLRNKLSQ